jgi:hypothetical protein
LSAFDSATFIRSTAIDSIACSRMGMTDAQVVSQAKLVSQWMDKNRQSSVPAWQKEVWPLNVEGAHHWRLKSSKNMARHMLVNARMALNEQMVAMNYRSKLLQFSEAARWLRNAFQAAMDPWCASWKVTIDGKDRLFKGFVYPDLLDCDVMDAPPEVNLDELKKARQISAQEEQDINDFRELIAKIQKQSFLQASTTTVALSDDVRDAIDLLAKVCILFVNASIFADSKQAGRTNIKRRAAMKRAEGEGVNLKDIDPMDPEYVCGDLTAAELSFYKRIDGWSELQQKETGKVRSIFAL